MSRWFVVGPLSSLGATETPPRRRGDGRILPRTLFWLASGTVGRREFRTRRGVVVEDRAYHEPHDRIVARVLPDDAEDELLRLNAAVEAAEKVLADARRERREFLAAQVPRARLVKETDARDPEDA